MINNEYHLIGICVTDFELVSSKKYGFYSMKVEIEKYNGNTFQLEVVVYSSNKVVNPSKSMIGKQVAINGYIDALKLDDGSLKLKLVVQNIMELTRSNNMSVESPVAESKAAIVEDDDLPF